MSKRSATSASASSSSSSFSSSAPSSISKEALDHLNDSHRILLTNYLKFLRGRAEQQVKEAEAQIEDTKEMRILEEMYSHDDVLNILDGLRDVTRSSLSEELQKFCHQQGLFLRLLLLSAEGYGISLSVETAQLDDAVMLEWLKKFEIDVQRKSDLPDTPGVKRLPSVSGTVDVKLVTKIKDLEDANRAALTRFEKLQQQCMAALKENSELKEKLKDANSDASNAKRDLENVTAANRSAQLDEIEALRAELKASKEDIQAVKRQAELDVKAAKDALESKVNASPQFQQLKKILAQKNQQLKEFRDRLKALDGDDSK